MRWCWVNFQRRGVLLIWIRVGQGPTALAVGAGGGCLDIFSLVYHFSFLSPSLWETARYRLKYCLKGPLSPKQPTNHGRQNNLAKLKGPHFVSIHFRGWLGGAMVLGKLPVPGRPTICITVGQGPTALAAGAGGGCLDICTLINPFSPLSLSLGVVGGVVGWCDGAG